MAVAFDASSFGTVTSTASVSHTPTGTPRGVVVCICQSVVATDLVSGVTYGGVTMSRVDTTSVSGGSGDVGRTYVYFLGASIPTGTQNATVTVSSGTDIKAVWVLSLTAAANTEVGTFHNVATSTSLANPSVTVPTDAGFTGIAIGAIYSGNTSPSNITAGAGYALRAGSVANGHDFGSQSAAVEQGAKSGANVAVNFTTVAEDVAMVALAVQEQAGGGGTTYQPTGSLTSSAANVGADVREAAEAGTLVADTTTAGADVREASELGALITAAQMRGADVLEDTQTGALTTQAILAGVGAREAAGKTGELIAGAALAGADVSERAETGTLTASALAEAAATFEDARTGTLAADTTAAGASVKESAGKAGALTAAGQQSGADAATSARTGALTPDTSLSGESAYTISRAGALVVATIVAGADQHERARAGAIYSVTLIAGTATAGPLVILVGTTGTMVVAIVNGRFARTKRGSLSNPRQGGIDT